MTMPERLAAALADRYLLERELGQGGMATVYLAEDIKHHRKVAIKVMRPELAAVIGADRFLAEIRTTANLQHPHILPLHDSGEVEGTVFYVMPFVPGESLRDRLDREQQLPVADALRIVSEVAAALDYAHRHGVIHRDIKPENILLHDGSALVADFGIALAASRTDGSTRMTETGMSLGTPTYMSPEQAMGERTLDARTDIYALGCVLYESLVGEPPFTGPSAQAIIARVMTESPRSLTAQRNTVPPHVDTAISIALAKLPADRFATAAAFADALARPDATAMMTAARGAVSAPPRPRWLTLLPWGVAAAAVAVALWIGLGRGPERTPTAGYLSLGPGVNPTGGRSSDLAISPDGTTMVFSDSATGQLWVKRAARLEPVAIPGTEGADRPTFSPDGGWLAFTAEGKVRKVRLDGSAPITVADSAALDGGGIAWLADGSLVYVGTGHSVLYRVAATGGPITTVLPKPMVFGRALMNLSPLPDSRGVLFGTCDANCSQHAVHVLDLDTGDQKVVTSDGYQGIYLPTGHLLYTVGRTAAAAPLDLDALALSGPPVQVIEDVFALGSLAMSADGTIIYWTAGGSYRDREFVRVDRGGRRSSMDTSWHGAFTNGEFSPTGDRFATAIGVGSESQGIWIKNLGTGAFSPLTSTRTARRPIWSPDGRTIAFIHDSASVSQVYTQPVDGSRPAERAFRVDRSVQELAWSPDGAWIVVRTETGEAGDGDILAFPTAGDQTPVTVAASPVEELYPAISPDGRWIAYGTVVAGQPEVYVARFPPAGDARWQVSRSGGVQPRWSPDGRELFYIVPGAGASWSMLGTMTAAELRLGDGVEVLARRGLFETDGLLHDGGHHHAYHVDPRDGSFSFMRDREDVAEAPRRHIVRIENWLSVLRERLAQ